LPFQALPQESLALQEIGPASPLAAIPASKGFFTKACVVVLEKRLPDVVAPCPNGRFH
jgi:hypothetical protein